MAQSIVAGLTGVEIREDLIQQLDNKLSKDCNLTANDSYSRGYSAKITYEIHGYGVDTVDVTGEIQVGHDDPSEKDAVTTKDSVEVAQELELNTVRERSNLAEPVMTIDSEGRPEVRKRKYQRRLTVQAPPEGLSGGAVDLDE